MFAVTTCVLGWVLLCPVAGGPVPADPPPDPLGRGYLGATFDNSSEAKSTVITVVTPGQPAAKAGIRAGDQVVRVGSVEPRSFQELLTHLCSYRPGAVVEVEVRPPADGLACRLTVRFDGRTIDALAKEARRLGIGPATLVRMWTLERLQQGA